MTGDAGTFAAFAEDVRRTGLLSDPWFDGTPRLDPEPLVLAREAAREIAQAAEDVALLLQKTAEAAAREPALLERFFGLTPHQRLMFLASAPRWHGVARADVFLTAGGPRVCEMNGDTPSGQAEAVLLARTAAARRPDAEDPNAGFLPRFVALVRAHGAAVGRAEGVRVGIVYPTEMPEDLSMIRLYRDALVAAGMTVVLGSPFNLAPRADGGVRLLDAPIDVMIRHYKTDWWGERESPWDDEAPPPDAAPLAEALGAALAAEAAGKLSTLNPFGSVLTQNKRAFAFLWEERARFPKALRAAIERVIPPTYRLEVRDLAAVAAERARWVLKSDYGCEGAEVIVGADVSDEIWRASLAHARPGRWVLQERFEPLRDAEGASVNYGAYVLGGAAAGFLARVQRGATDVRARCTPVLVARGAGRTS